MTSIDSFINTPLLLCVGIGALLLVFLLIIKLRKTVKSSFIYFIVVGIIIFGAIYTKIAQEAFPFVVSIIAAEIVALPYAIVRAFDNPIKREEKKNAKKASEQFAINTQDYVSKQYVAELEEKHQKLTEVNKELISKVSTFFTNDNSMEGFLEYCNKLISEKVSADGCVILMADDYDNTLSVKSLTGNYPPCYKLPDDLPHKPIRVETNLRYAQFPLKENIFGDMFTEGEPVLIADSVKDPRIFQNGPEEFLKTGSYMFVPIKEKEGTVGVISLARLPQNHKFTKTEFETAIILADAIANAMKPMYSFLTYAERAELNKGGDIASKYQKDLLPAKLPVIPGLQIGCFTTPTENVVGDYYDVIVSRKDRVSFIMADVAGKGMNSLVVMLMLRAIMRLTVNTDQSASTILSWTNKGICVESSKIDHFASVSLLNYDSTTKTIQMATCGSNPVFHLDGATKTIKQISENSEPLGVDKDATYQDVTFSVNPGDIITVCTDGLIESLDENGVQYSSTRLSQLITKNCSLSAKDISAKIRDDLKKFTTNSQQYDDKSLLVIKIQ